MAKTVIALAIELTDQAHTQALAQIAQICEQAGIPMQVGVGTQAQAQTQAPAPAHTQRETRKARDYTAVPDAKDTTVVVTRLDETHLDIPYTAKAVRRALMKHLGQVVWAPDFVRDEVYVKGSRDGKYAAGEHKRGAYEGAQDALDALFEGKKTLTVKVTAAEIQAERDKLAAKHEEKGE